MSQNVLMDSKILKEKKVFFFFSMSCKNFVSFPKKLNLFVFLISYTCLHVIFYKCEHVLFCLNMLKNIFKRLTFFFEIKLIFNKKISFIYLIQKFNPHLFS
jgi:hypothetical protein